MLYNRGMAGKGIDFTEGPIRRNILLFAVPLLLSNLFQQLYNAADSVIVGNFVGAEALAAVSSSTPLINMMVGFFNGMAIGAGVVIARYFGAKDMEALRKAIHTDIAFGVVSGVFLVIAGTIFTPLILQWMDTPPDIMPESVRYFRIYSLGVIFSVLYNIMMGIMNAIGDSRHPLYYLILSSVINIFLDLFLVGVVHTGVGGAAFATIMSQAVSSVLCLRKLMHDDTPYRVRLRDIKIDKVMLRQIVSFGLPSGVQNSVINFANIIVQTNINSFASAAVAGSGAYSKIEGFAFLPITSFSLSLTTFVGQNLGARKHDRVKKGVRFGILCSMTLAECIGLTFFLLAPLLISLFNSSPEVVSFGVRQARIESLFYCFLALSHCIAGVLRGAGRATVPMTIMLSVWCVFRVLYITIALSVSHTIELVYMAYPITWMISSALFVFYLLKADWLHALERMHRFEAK